jgi:hypothetical protein
MKIYMNLKKEKTMEDKTNKRVDLSKMSAEEKAALLAELQTETQRDRLSRRETYEGLRKDFMQGVKARVSDVTKSVADFKAWLDDEVGTFTSLMREYGQVKTEGQQSYTITDGDFRLEVKFNKVKGFDERADMAAERLVEYLQGYMERSAAGVDDPMYQMAMTLLERNKKGDLDYKSISKLYELEDKFDGEYVEIMKMFREANVVQATATNYYFSERNDQTGVWYRIEPSFCRL